MDIFQELQEMLGEDEEDTETGITQLQSLYRDRDEDLQAELDNPYATVASLQYKRTLLESIENKLNKAKLAELWHHYSGE